MLRGARAIKMLCWEGVLERRVSESAHDDLCTWSYNPETWAQGECEDERLTEGA